MATTHKRLFYEVGRAHRLLTEHLKRRLAAAGLAMTPAQAGALFLLADQDGAKMGELAEALMVDNSALTRLADRLEKSGWLTRAPSPEDRRACLLHITPAGRGLAGQAARAINQANRELVAGLSAGDLEIFLGVLGKLAAACGEPPSPAPSKTRSRS